MNENEIVQGRWWVDGREREPVLGNLVLSDKEVLLTVQAVHGMSLSEVMNREPLKRVQGVIVGLDIDNRPITLFGCTLDSHSTHMGIELKRYSALRAVRGLDIEGWKIPAVKSVSLRLKHLSRWFEHKRLTTTFSENDQTAYAPAEELHFQFEIEEGVTLVLSDKTTHRETSDESTFVADSRVLFDFETARSLEEVADRWIPWANRLFGLLIGTDVSSTDVTVCSERCWRLGTGSRDVEGQLISSGVARSRQRLSDPGPNNMITTFEWVRSEFGTIVLEWHRIHKQLAAVIDLFAVVALHWQLYPQATFMFLVQALEIYHTCSKRFEPRELSKQEHELWVKETVELLPEERRSWAEGKLRLNSKRLAQKLADVFAAHNEVAKELFNDCEDAASRIAYTRNVLTHFQEKPNQRRFLSEKELWPACYRLEVLLWVILLSEIKVGGKSVDRVMRRVRGVTFVNLHD